MTRAVSVILGGTVAIFLLRWFLPEIETAIFDATVLVNSLVARGEWWRMVTYVLLHANLPHVAMNMFALVIIGPAIEKAVGSARFIALYVTSATAGGAAVALLAGPGTGAVGASGAIFGLLGFWLVEAFTSRDSRARALRRRLLQLLAINLAISLIPGVSWQGHLGGLIGGSMTTVLWSRSRSRPGRDVALAAAVAGFALILAVW